MTLSVGALTSVMFKVSPAPLDDAEFPPLADLVASAEVVGAAGTRAIAVASTTAGIGIRRGKVDIIDDGAFSQVAAGLAQTRKIRTKKGGVSISFEVPKFRRQP